MYLNSSQLYRACRLGSDRQVDVKKRLFLQGGMAEYVKSMAGVWRGYGRGMAKVWSEWMWHWGSQGYFWGHI